MASFLKPNDTSGMDSVELDLVSTPNPEVGCNCEAFRKW